MEVISVGRRPLVDDAAFAVARLGNKTIPTVATLSESSAAAWRSGQAARLLIPSHWKFANESQKAGELGFTGREIQYSPDCGVGPRTVNLTKPNLGAARSIAGVGVKSSLWGIPWKTLAN
jgi:hypothetical protein